MKGRNFIQAMTVAPVLGSVVSVEAEDSQGLSQEDVEKFSKYILDQFKERSPLSNHIIEEIKTARNSELTWYYGEARI